MFLVQLNQESMINVDTFVSKGKTHLSMDGAYMQKSNRQL